MSPALATEIADADEALPASERTLPVPESFYCIINRKEHVGQREAGYLEQNWYSQTVLEIEEKKRKRKLLRFPDVSPRRKIYLARMNNKTS